MISEFDLAKALRDHAVIVAAANNYVLVSITEEFDPVVGESHIEEFVLYNENNSIGMADTSSNIQLPIYQLSVHSPTNQSKFVGLQIIDILKASFSRGLELTQNGQMVRIKNSSLATMDKNDTHFIWHLSIECSVIN